MKRTMAQKRASKANIKKAQKKWSSMSKRSRARAMPGGKGPIRKR